jgi:hypothetical protein
LLVVPLKGMFIATMYLIRYQSDVLAVPIPAFRKQRAFRWHHAEPRDMAKSRSSAHL